MQTVRHIGQLIVSTGPETAVTLPLFQRQDGRLFFAPFEDIADGDPIAEASEKLAEVIETVREDEAFWDTEHGTGAAAGGDGPLSSFTLVTTDRGHGHEVPA